MLFDAKYGSHSGQIGNAASCPVENNLYLNLWPLIQLFCEVRDKSILIWHEVWHFSNWLLWKSFNLFNTISAILPVSRGNIMWNKIISLIAFHGNFIWTEQVYVIHQCCTTQISNLCLLVNILRKTSSHVEVSILDSVMGQRLSTQQANYSSSSFTHAHSKAYPSQRIIIIILASLPWR